MCRNTPDNVECYSQQRRALAEGSMKSARVCRRDGCADDHVIRQLMIARQTKHYRRYTHTQCIIASQSISMQVTILPALAPSTMDV